MFLIVSVYDPERGITKFWCRDEQDNLDMESRHRSG